MKPVIYSQLLFNHCFHSVHQAPAAAGWGFLAKQLSHQKGVIIIRRANSCTLGRGCSQGTGRAALRCPRPPQPRLGPGVPASPGASSAGPGPRGREPPGPRANGCGGGGSAWTFPLGYRMEIPGLPGEGARAPRSERLIYPRAAAQSGGHGLQPPPGPAAPPPPPARAMPRAPAAAPLLLLALLLAAAPPPGGSESPKGKQKALRQREVVDVVRAAAGRGAGLGAAGPGAAGTGLGRGGWWGRLAG